MNLKRIFLIGACLIVIVVALGYGVAPSWFAQTFLGIESLPLNQAHILRAIMGLYLAMGLYWGWAAFHDRHADGALVTVLVFNAGLLLGRAFSMASDGMPAPLLQGYALIELGAIPAAWWLLRRSSA